MTPARVSQPGSFLLFLVVLGACVAGSYFVLRYAGLWSEHDTQAFGAMTQGLQVHERLQYRGNYANGFLYPLWLSQMSTFTGESVADLTQLHLPLVAGLLLGILGYAMSRRLLGSSRSAALATALLLLVPELLFTMFRGNHEKLTVSLTLIAVLALLSSFIELFTGRRWTVFSAWVGTYYLAAFALVSVHAFFGSSFILASTLSLVFAFAASLLFRPMAPQLLPVSRRLLIVSATSWAFTALVMLFLYEPAGNTFRLLETGVDRVASLALSLTPESDPYRVTATDWRSPQTYRVISAFQWVLLAASMVTWLTLVRRLWNTAARMPLNLLYLTALYAAFALQVGLAVVVDLSGHHAGTNLQVRLYTYYALLAAPMVAYGVSTASSLLKQRAGGWLFTGGVSAAYAVFALLSLSKATLDPSVANRWLFYRPSETQAMRFWDERARMQQLWVGFEPRLRHAYRLLHPEDTVNENAFLVQTASSSLVYALDSDLIRQNTIAWRSPVSHLLVENRAYDNGETRVMHRVPRTPFQN